jgi:hypothetical protein
MDRNQHHLGARAVLAGVWRYGGLLPNHLHHFSAQPQPGVIRPVLGCAPEACPGGPACDVAASQVRHSGRAGSLDDSEGSALHSSGREFDTLYLAGSLLAGTVASVSPLFRWLPVKLFCLNIGTGAFSTLILDAVRTPRWVTQFIAILHAGPSGCWSFKRMNVETSLPLLQGLQRSGASSTSSS